MTAAKLTQSHVFGQFRDALPDVDPFLLGYAMSQCMRNASDALENGSYRVDPSAPIGFRRVTAEELLRGETIASLYFGHMAAEAPDAFIDNSGPGGETDDLYAVIEQFQAVCADLAETVTNDEFAVC